MSEATDHLHLMRAPCKACGYEKGVIRTVSGQDTVRCAQCSRHCYNAPKTETGRAVRSLASRPDLKPSSRTRILDRFGYACSQCGRRAPDVELQIDHIIPRQEAERHGLLDDLIDSEDNLIPSCAECNSGRNGIPWTWRQVVLVRRAILMAQQAAGR